MSVVHACPVLGLAGKEGDHVSGKRCSGLELLSCDHGSGYAARGCNTRETELAYGSLRVRDDVRAASSSSHRVCRISGAPPLCAPARVIPGRTLLECEGRAGYRASPQLQGTPLFIRPWPAGVPVAVPPGCQSAQRFTGFPVAAAIALLNNWIKAALGRGPLCRSHRARKPLAQKPGCWIRRATACCCCCCCCPDGGGPAGPADCRSRCTLA